MLRYAKTGAVALPIMMLHANAMAATDSDIESLKNEIQNMRSTYESRINQLEDKLQTMQAEQAVAPQTAAPAAKPAGGSGVFDNSFNPAVGIILNGTYGGFSGSDSKLSGFAIGEEGGRLPQGLSLGESELNFGANIDDKFSGSLTAAIASEDGQDTLELEEAFVKTSGGTLPGGLTAKFGRMLASVGYLNDHHAHTDDFADRPLPYRNYLNGAYKDDGLEVSWILPTDLYAELGGGVFRGDHFPYGSASGNGSGSWTLFARTGGDIGDNQNWRFGLSTLQGDTPERKGNDDNVTFAGDSDLYIADLRYTWAPTGNPYDQEVMLQGEYLYRSEKGTYADTNAAIAATPYDSNDNGWYAQAVYKFLPQWRAGTRYARLNAPNIPAGLAGSELDSQGHDPYSISAMVEWDNSEFSRIRLQFNHERPAASLTDDQIILQYTMSLGAHGAHSY
ncbi:MAG: hypothetical protein GC134_08525 [Proteobacteria bacterium]|nr:hypothetical protein [Pseudomonadota bacterium]